MPDGLFGLAFECTAINLQVPALLIRTPRGASRALTLMTPSCRMPAAGQGQGRARRTRPRAGRTHGLRLAWRGRETVKKAQVQLFEERSLTNMQMYALSPPLNVSFHGFNEKTIDNCSALMTGTF